MKKRVSDKFWFPFWVDKWIWGSMRIECTVEERAIWIDLLALATKDDGFIRANEDIPYPTEQLAGMLRIPKDRLQKSINKFVRIKKITKHQNKTLYITEWKKYQFTDRHKRRVMSDETDTVASKGDAILKNKKEKNNKEDNNKKYAKEFDVFWDIYNLKTAKQDALKAFNALRRTGVDFETIREAVKGYANHLKSEHQNGFDKKQKYPAGFLRNEFWKDFIGVKYEAPL